MEDVVHPGHHAAARLQAAHVSDEELDLVGYPRIARLVLVAHVVLLLLVAAENAYLPDVGVQEPAEHGVAERSRATRN